MKAVAQEVVSRGHKTRTWLPVKCYLRIGPSAADRLGASGRLFRSVVEKKRGRASSEFCDSTTRSCRPKKWYA